MAERSFKQEVAKLKLGAGQEFRGEGILAVTKALLQSGVSYVSGYQGAPISHLVDVLADANDILQELGIRFEASANEAAAAAALAASINYPLRGAATFKSTVGTNVASDALANLASSGVTGGALIIVGEDYGEGSSIMQERSHAFAMKSQIWLLDPRPNLPSIVRAVEKGFELVGSLEHAGDAGAAHPRLPRLRQLHRDRQRAAGFHAQGRAREPGARHQPHRAAAGELPARTREDREALARRGAVRRAEQAQRVLRRRRRRHRHRHAGRHVQHRAAGARSARPRRHLRREPHPALRAQRHLSADRRRVRALLRRQEGDPGDRGGPAGIHRAGGQHHPAARRHPDPDRRQRHAADGRRIYRRRDEGGRAEIRRGPSARSARRGPRASARFAAVRPPRARPSRRSPARCTAARPRSAPAARSGRSSPP